MQESRALAPLPCRMKAAEQTGENQRRLHPTGSPLGFRTAGPAASSYISRRLSPALRSGLFFL